MQAIAAQSSVATGAIHTPVIPKRGGKVIKKQACKTKLRKNTAIFEHAELNAIPYGISSLTYQENLQGAKNQKEFDTLECYLSTQKIFHPSLETFKLAAKIYFDARKRGKTIRSSIDCIIMATAELEGLVVLSDDGDFIN